MEAYLDDMNDRTVKCYVDTDDNCFFVGNEPPVAIGDVVKELRYHAAKGEGDKHFVDMYFEDGSVIRDFQVACVYWDVNT